MPTSLTYRLRIRSESTALNPDGLTDALTITSQAGGSNPYLSGPPAGDGQEVDPLTGAVRTGSYTVEVVDVATGADATGTVRVMTNTLEDGYYRQQFLQRRAYVDLSENGGSTWTTLIGGYVLGIRLVSPVRYAITIGDTRRTEQTQSIFTGSSLGGYATRGCLTGGPLTANWGPIKARGGWTYRITHSGGADASLQFVSGYASYDAAPVVTDWTKLVTQRVVETVMSRQTVNPNATSIVTPATSQFVTLYTGITVYVGTTAGNAAATAAQLVSTSAEVGPSSRYPYSGADPFAPGTLYLYNAAGWSMASGSLVYVSLVTEEVSDLCPLYLDAHPVDIVTAIWSAARINYDASGAWIASVRSLIGDNVRLACRFTSAPVIADFLESAIYGPFGIAARTDGSGRQELCPVRLRTASAPSLTIAAADLRDASGIVFDLDERTTVATVTLEQEAYTPATIANTSDLNSIPSDGVFVQRITQTANGIDTVYSAREVSFSIPGMIHTSADFEPRPYQTLQGVAVPIFQRYGRGAQAADVAVLRGSSGAAAQIGDEVYFNAPHFPNRNYRIGESTVGARIMQVIRRTETPAGPVFRLLDSGVDAQPVSPAAAITVAQQTTQTALMAAYTIGNAAAINATGVLSVAVEWTVSATTPTTGGADAIRYGPNMVPSGAVPLPGLLTSGQTVWVRARTEQWGRRPSAWTAWSSVTLTTIPTPGTVSVSSITATAAGLAWSNTSTTYPLALFVAPGSSAPADWAPYRVASLPAGTTSTVARNLAGASLPYIVGLAYETGLGLGPVRTATFTTTATLPASSRPAAIWIIPGLDNATARQGVALALWASDVSQLLVIQRTTDSGGAPNTGAWADVATVDGTTSVYVDALPRDGTPYWYRIAHILGGFDRSAYTPAVQGTASGIPDTVERPGAVLPVVQVSTIETTTTGSVILGVTDDQKRVTQVRFRERTDGVNWSAWSVVSTPPTYIYAQLIPATGFLDIQYEVTAYNAAGVASVIAGGVESFDKNTVPTIVSANGTFDLAGALLVTVSADTDTQSFKYAIATTPWASDAAAYTAAQAGTTVNGRTASLTFSGPYAVGSTVYLALAAYAGASGTGAVSGPFRYAFINGSRDTVALSGRARVLTTTATTIAVRYAVAVPVAPSPNTATIAYQTVGLGSVTPASGQSVTPEAAFFPSEAAGSYVDFTVPRPAAGSPTGRITFSVTATGQTADTDSVDVPAQDIVGPSLQVVTTPGASTFTIVVTYDGTMTYTIDGGSPISGTGSPQTIVVTRNPYLGASIAYSFKCVRDGITVSDNVIVPPVDNLSGASITIGTQNADATTNVYTFAWSSSGLPSGTTFDLIYRTTTTGGVVEEGVLNNQTSPVNVTSGYSIGANPRYVMTINAIKDSVLLLTRSRSGTFVT